MHALHRVQPVTRFPVKIGKMLILTGSTGDPKRWSINDEIYIYNFDNSPDRPGPIWISKIEQ
jgi:hypothetical protein